MEMMEMVNGKKLPVAVIGAGPVGLAAAARLVERGETPLVLEAGGSVGASVLGWAHVRLFSPWRYGVDEAAGAMLEEAGWAPPDPDAYPTGGELVERYLKPLSGLPQIEPHLRLGVRVLSVSRRGFDKMKTVGREAAPFELRTRSSSGREERFLARAVIDASGTWGSPNPLGSGGVPAPGEEGLSGRIRYGIPDVLGSERGRYAGRRVLVVGGGHSAFNAVLDLANLAEEEPGTEVTWAVRRPSVGQLFGGGENDVLEARGELGERVRGLVEGGVVRLVTGFKTIALSSDERGIVVAGEHESVGPVDEVVAATGFRPDLSLARELRLSLDPAVESPAVLAPMIDPNHHSCGTVRPHGEAELAHPEEGFYVAGMKSYGRAPTFLMLTGYEQVRSIVAALAGDWEAARNVELELPETGVCSVGGISGSDAGCCATGEEHAVAAPRELVSLTGKADGAGGSRARERRDAGCCG